MPLVLGPDANYYPAPAQPYPTGYPRPMATLPQHYTGPQGHREEDSETAKPDKFTGRTIEVAPLYS